MYCPKCGTQNKDASNFCISCGTNLKDERLPVSTPKPSADTVPTSGWVCKYCGGRTPDWSSRCKQCGKEKYEVLAPEYTHKWVKDLFRSVLFLMLTIAFSVVLFLNITQAVDTATGLSSTIEDIASSLDLPSSAVSLLTDKLDDLENKVAGFQLLIHVPNILIVIGLWMLYIEGVTTAHTRIAPTGAKLIHAGYTIIATVTDVLLVICNIIMFAAYSEIPLDSWYDSLRDAFGGIIFALLIITALVFVYFIMLLNTTKAIINTIESSIPDVSLSRTIAVLFFISGGMQALSVLSGDGSLLIVANAASQILAGIAIFSARSSLETLSAKRVQALRTADHPGVHTGSHTTTSEITLWTCRECGSTNRSVHSKCQICGVEQPGTHNR